MKKAYLLFLAAMLSTATFADNKQTVKIDGQGESAASPRITANSP